MDKINLVVLSLVLFCNIGCTAVKTVSESYQLSKDADRQSDIILLRRSANTAVDDLIEIRECLRQNNFKIGSTVMGKYAVVDGYHFLSEIEYSENSLVGLTQCSELILKKRKNIAHGLSYNPQNSKRSYYFTFKADFYPKVSGAITSDRYQVSEKFSE